MDTTPLRTTLWRNIGFLKLWGATSVSHVGSMLGALSLTALLTLDASAAEMGVLAAATGAPVLLFSLVAGVWIDRLPRRRLLVLADIGRFVLLLTVPAAWALDSLRIEQLYVVAFLVSALGVVFDLSYRSALPGLVGRGELIEANSKLQMSESVAESASPALGGALVQAVSGPFAVLCDALSFLISGFLVGTIKGEGAVIPTERESLFKEAREGLRAVWRSSILRAFAGTAATMSLSGGFFAALYGVWVIRELEFSPLAYGALVGAGGVGSFLGVALVGPAARRLGLGPAMTLARLLSGFLALLIPLAGGPDCLAFSLLLTHQLFGDGLWVMYEINATSLRQAVTPDAQLGRVNASFLLLGEGLHPMSALVAGILAVVVGVQAALFIGAIGMCAAVLWLLASPVPSIRSTTAP
jgi:predicted MFS family arabinose efflux permease